jgi:hypothetical protein
MFMPVFILSQVSEQRFCGEEGIQKCQALHGQQK